MEESTGVSQAKKDPRRRPKPPLDDDDLSAVYDLEVSKARVM
jgi:hypothetical protein